MKNFLMILLGTLAAAYVSLGLYALAFENPRSFPIDLRLRWFELGLLYDGLDPQAGGRIDPITHKTHPNVSLRGSEYPPWAYATAMLLIPPLKWTAARIYFAAADAVALAVIALWAHRTAKAHGADRPRAALGIVSSLALFPIAICLSYGQYTIVVTACLCACLLLCEAGRDYAGGLFLGMAMIKPHLAAIFFLPMLLGRRFLALAGAATWMAAASCATWAISGEDPIRMLLGGLRTSGRVLSPRAHNLLILAAKDMLGDRAATIAVAGAGAALGAVLLAYKRNYRNLLISFSVCAFIAMYWSYRKHYDCVLLVFPITGLLLLWQRTNSRRSAIAFLAFGSLLWSPLRDTQWTNPLIFFYQLIIWTSGILLLCATGDRLDPSKAPTAEGPIHDRVDTIPTKNY